MLTRVPEAAKEQLKNLAMSGKDYNTLRSMCEYLLVQFIKTKPYQKKGFEWIQPAPRHTSGWIAYNVVVSDELSEEVKQLSLKLEVSLTTVLHTALIWHANKEIPDFLKKEG